MKKRFAVLAMIGVLALTGCQAAEADREKQFAESLEDAGVSYDSVVMNVLAKEWKAENGDIYTFTKDADGTISGEAFTYTCGVDENNEIVLQIVMDASEETRNYYVTTDETGYGLYLEPAGGGERIYILQTNVSLLGTDDALVAGLFGEWADKSDNRYIFNEDGTMQIKGSSGDREGTYSVAETDNGIILKMLFGADELEFNYEFSDDGHTMELVAPGTETVHTWTKQ